MIRVTKPTVIPQILTTKGKKSCAKICSDYDADPKSFVGKKIKIDNKIYGHSSVKKILKKVQNNKCCFCEKDQVDEFGAVEHFRPKLGYRSTKKQKLIKPGYYWLGYDWNNLYFVCSGCNSSGNKGNLFPLEDEANRAKSHKIGIAHEISFLLDPTGPKDPRDHIIFQNQFPKGKTTFGKKTIEICGIDRDALNEKRNRLIEDIDARIAILGKRAHHSNAEIEKAKKYLKKSITPKAEFSATAIDYLKNFNIIIV